MDKNVGCFLRDKRMRLNERVTKQEGSRGAKRSESYECRGNESVKTDWRRKVEQRPESWLLQWTRRTGTIRTRGEGNERTEEWSCVKVMVEGLEKTKRLVATIVENRAQAFRRVGLGRDPR